MPWKSGYTISDERGIADRDIRWPRKAKCCLTVTVALDPDCGSEGLTSEDVSTPEAFYGMNGGLDLVRGLLDQVGYRATFVVSAAMADAYPKAIKKLADDGHEVAAHGYLREDVSSLDRDEERLRLKRTTEVIASIAGRRPLGWYSLPRRGDRYATGAVSPNTMGLLSDEGYVYMGNSLADDVPHYWVTKEDGPSTILAMPYYYHFDDMFFLMFPAEGTGLEHADSLARNWRAEFDAQLHRGRSFGMVVHPYAIAWAHRFRLMSEFLSYVKTIEGVWNGTAVECAQHWLKEYPADSTFRLKPSIWTNYSDSLS
jgi:peptidoglycan/xylan/chitin deacetylase (PgdA/CDA1 family)